MKQRIKVTKENEMLILAENIAYRRVGDWYDVTWQELKMDIICPKERGGHAPQPCLLWFCGGAFITERKDVWLPEMVDFARRGYTVACVDYRTSDKAPFPAFLTDAKGAVRFLRAHAADFCIDPERIFAAGESAGGTVASLLGVTSGMEGWDDGDFLEESSAISGVVDYYGLADVTRVVKLSAENVPNWQIRAFIGEPAEENAAAASAVRYVTADTCPFLIFHGTADMTAPITQSETMYRAISEAGVRVDYYEVEGASHGDPLFYQPETRRIADEFLRSI